MPKANETFIIESFKDRRGGLAKPGAAAAAKPSSAASRPSRFRGGGSRPQRHHVRRRPSPPRRRQPERIARQPDFSITLLPTPDPH